MTQTESPSAGPREMRLRYAGRCRECATELPRGSRASYDPGTKTVCCLGCPVPATADLAPPGDDTAAGETVHAETGHTPAPAPPPAEEPIADEKSPGVAGSSARREHERRVAKREERIRSKHPRLGGLILALSDDPQTTKAWATGAVGEERLGRRLDAAAGPLVRVLHDRGIPRSRANLDHLVVCASGVFVVDAKRYQGRPHRVVEGGLFTPRTEKLLVGRRDCTRLVDAGLKQADLVRGALADETVGVRSVLCFVEADWPLFGGDFVLRDVTVTWPKKLAATIARPGPLTEERITAIHQRLAVAFPPA
ncbi:nuclease-related domain-containing protein [Ornithinimicrobium sp. LYQ92]|uniref:nuclease-related domain-containing protein n=1 Tax=Serinicoccus sp. LYQ92 TaxID=3378798 RepID=UPI003854BE40